LLVHQFVSDIVDAEEMTDSGSKDVLVNEIIDPQLAFLLRQQQVLTFFRP
jgi:hypothetical protein